MLDCPTVRSASGDKAVAPRAKGDGVEFAQLRRSLLGRDPQRLLNVDSGHLSTSTRAPKTPEIVVRMGKAAPTLDLASRAVSAICNLDDGGRAAALLTSPLLPHGVTPHHYTTHTCNIRVCALQHRRHC
jgi:hypothetical protein